MIRRLASSAVLGVTVAFAFAGCTAADPLSQQFRSGDGGYLSADGRVTEFPVGERGDPISFTTKDAAGLTVTAEQFRGKVLVLNFWFAGCGPCRLEAKDLREASAAEADTATFLGVNTRDSAASVDAFVSTYSVPYDNVLDGQDSAVQLSFAGVTAPNTTPSTLVLDAQGRVSARMLGPVDPQVLSGLIADAAE